MLPVHEGSHFIEAAPKVSVLSPCLRFPVLEILAQMVVAKLSLLRQNWVVSCLSSPSSARTIDARLKLQWFSLLTFFSQDGGQRRFHTGKLQNNNTESLPLDSFFKLSSIRFQQKLLKRVGFFPSLHLSPPFQSWGFMIVFFCYRHTYMAASEITKSSPQYKAVDAFCVKLTGFPWCLWNYWSYSSQRYPLPSWICVCVWWGVCHFNLSACSYSFIIQAVVFLSPNLDVGVLQRFHFWPYVLFVDITCALVDMFSFIKTYLSTVFPS